MSVVMMNAMPRWIVQVLADFQNLQVFIGRGASKESRIAKMLQLG